MNISTLCRQKSYDFVTPMVIKDMLAPTFPVCYSRMWTDARHDMTRKTWINSYPGPAKNLISVLRLVLF